MMNEVFLGVDNESINHHEKSMILVVLQYIDLRATDLKYFSYHWFVLYFSLNVMYISKGFWSVFVPAFMMTSSNGNIFRVTGPLCGEFTGPGEFPTQRPVTRSFDVFFDLRLNKRLSKQWWDWWFETLSRSFWRHCDVLGDKPTPPFIQLFMCTSIWCVLPWYI